MCHDATPEYEIGALGVFTDFRAFLSAAFFTTTMLSLVRLIVVSFFAFFALLYRPLYTLGGRLSQRTVIAT